MTKLFYWLVFLLEAALAVLFKETAWVVISSAGMLFAALPLLFDDEREGDKK